MKKAVEHLKKDLATIRTGRASPALLEKVVVDYYGTPTPVNQLATITSPEPRLLVIQPWDRSTINDIEKAILKSDLGITPTNDGQVIRLALPQLTQQRREELVRLARKRAEEARVAVRNLRREANDELKEKQKKENVSEDEIKRLQGEVQKLTEKYIKEIDTLLAAKEKEILEV
ncbi:ribosome recycling factor [Desulfothermobacter acidiphilus]|uniref:ribosome recycling factor n=1 Tax=Desulfothermobacter acidiphilus TaxID=1938353 RepID=UPI003F8C5E49